MGRKSGRTILVGENLEAENLEELELLFKKLSVVMQKGALEPAIEAGAQILVEAIKQKAPVASSQSKHSHDKKYGHRPGFLRDSISYKMLTRKEGVVIAMVSYLQDAFYGYFIEKGTSNMGATPFIKPSFEESATKVEAKMAEIAREHMTQVVEDAKKECGVE